MRYTYYKGNYVPGLRYRTNHSSSYDCIVRNLKSGWIDVGIVDFKEPHYTKTTRDKVRKLYPKAFKH